MGSDFTVYEQEFEKDTVDEGERGELDAYADETPPNATMPIYLWEFYK
jgi:hypothetical protein